MEEIRPQLGPQEMFLSSPADIVIYGGGAGSGKTYGLLLDPIRYVSSVKGFGAVIFRRNAVQVRNEGGLWDESETLYPLIGGVPREATLEWSFPPYANKIKFAHLEHENTVLNWQGSQICLICFDELTHFSQKQFFYMLSRNRSTCGVRPYVRATTNPDAESWVADFISWWIDQNTGLPIPERSGVLRYFIRLGNELYWGDSPEDLWKKVEGNLYKDHFRPRSVTFIAAKLDDNPILEQLNPDYRANLLSLPLVERERLLNGNWKIKQSAGLMFQRGWFEMIDTAPADIRKVRAWDRAATADAGDWTVGILMGEKNGITYILDMIRFRGTSHINETTIKNTAELDGRNTWIALEQEPGSAGKDVIDYYTRKVLYGHTVKVTKPTGSKTDRAGPLSSQVQAGNVKILKGSWNQMFFDEMEAFPPETEEGHDDIVDASSLAFNTLASGITSVGTKSSNPFMSRNKASGFSEMEKRRRGR